MFLSEKLLNNLKTTFEKASYEILFEYCLYIAAENEALIAKVQELESDIDYYEKALLGISDDEN